MASATFLGSSDLACSAACGDDLHRGVAVERVGLRVELLGLELLRRRPWPPGACAGPAAEGHQRAFDARAADGGELVRGDAVAAHQRRP